jgi:hypothetical protein
MRMKQPLTLILGGSTVHKSEDIRSAMDENQQQKQKENRKLVAFILPQRIRLAVIRPVHHTRPSLVYDIENDKMDTIYDGQTNAYLLFVA